MVHIIPSILVPSKNVFLEQIKAVEDRVSLVQIDIADGVFVPEKTWADPDVVAETLNIDCELHLMVEDPLKEVRRWTEVRQVKRILVHHESDPEHIADMLAQIHSYGWEVGVVLNPETSADAIESFLEEIDSVMFMGVKPGKQGQALIPAVLEKISACKKAHPNLFVEIDGGVNDETLPEILKTGVDGVCPGSAIFGNDREPSENILRMKKHAEALLSSQ